MDRDSSAPFNMALATLERVNDILRDISQISDSGLDPVTSNWVRYKKLKDLFQASIPLIPDKKTKEELRMEINGLIKLFGSSYNVVNRKRVASCKMDTEDILNYTIDKVQESLQVEKYFMPSKSDPKFGWKAD